MIGRTLGHFRIEAKLGEGGMGVVYRATDETLRREVALKVLPHVLAADEHRRRRFLREARLAAAVTHPAIATVYEVGEADGEIFIAMELVQGETLRKHLARGLSHAEVLGIARQIARGLARAHDKGVIHRDLKPENVMVTAEGEAKILDFGIAKLRRMSEDEGQRVETVQLTADGLVVGTADYMSPEQLEGRPDLDARSDIFSFGVLLYELLAGVRPFRGATKIETLYLIAHSEPVPLEQVCPGVPPELANIVARCLRKESAERFASGRELAAALDVDTSPFVALADSESPTFISSKPVSSDRTRVFATPHLGSSGDSASATRQLIPVSPVPAGGNQTPPPRPRKLRWGVLTAFLAIAVAGGIAGSRSHRSPTAHLPQHGVAMTDHPLPASSNREALAHYASALSRLRIGALESSTELEKAAALDPTLAAAQLRLALYGDYYQLPEAERRSHFAQATALAASLEPRDQALLPVAEAIASDPVNFRLALERLQAVAERYPDDAEIALLHFLLLFRSERPEAEAMARHVLELDPKCTQVFIGQLGRALQREQLSLAAILADHCLLLSPEASTCRDGRIAIETAEGKCDAMLEDARALARQEPDVPAGYERLAQALAATHAPPESIQDVLSEAEAHEIASASRPKGLTRLELATLRGDFAEADQLALALMPEAAKSNSELQKSYLAMLRIQLAEETGDRAKALAIAESFEREALASTPNAPLEVRAKELFLRHEAGRLSDAGLAEALERLMNEALQSRAGTPPWTVLGSFERLRATSLPLHDDRDTLCLFVNAAYAETPVEAKNALASGKPLPLSLEKLRSNVLFRSQKLEFGRLLLLAGRVDEALPLLESLARSCAAIGNFNLFDLTTSLDYLHAQLLLGEALEAKGDKSGACQAYESIQTRWKKVTPRSVTVETARDRARALGCVATAVTTKDP